MTISWLGLLNGVCIGLPVVAFASPITVFVPVFCGNRRGMELDMPPLAVTSQMLQCYLFAVYALSLGNMITLLIPNCVGFLLGLLWSTLYPHRMARENEMGWRLQYFGALFCMLICTWFAYGRSNPYVASTIAAAVGVVLCTYPLPSMKQAYQTLNPALLGSVYMNLAMLASCVSWVIHASPLVQLDGFVLVSNGAGVIVQGSAILLRAYIQIYHGATSAAVGVRGNDQSTEYGIIKSYQEVYDELGSGDDVKQLRGSCCDMVLTDNQGLGSGKISSRAMGNTHML